MLQVKAPRLGESYVEREFPGGLTVRVIPKPGFAKKYAFLAADYGSIDTAFTRNGEKIQSPDGVAHYLEHKMFDLEDGNAMQLFAAAGGSPNAFTSYDMTAYYFICTDRFEDNLRILLRFVLTPYFTEESVEKEREIIGQEIRMYEDSADSRLYENLFSAMFRNHPIRVPIAGTAQSIAKITAKTLYGCYETFYAPSNMMLCVVGDVEPDVVFSAAEAMLPRERRGLPARDYGAAEAPDCGPQTVRQTMEIAMPMFSVGFRCEPPAAGRAGMKQEIVGDLACELLAGEASPLYQRLYDGNLIDSDFSSGFERVKGAALISFGGDSLEPETVQRELLEECRRQLAEGLDADAFRRLKKSAVGRRIRDLDSFESICYRMCASFFDGASYFEFPDVYEEITLEDVRAFLQSTVRENRMVLSVIEPKERG
ncbi:MAG: pitrilysin family protein [Oscillospiraceae bacterium]|nr:pitrilysin family protein [Oscillospiraceae bacterium]